MIYHSQCVEDEDTGWCMHHIGRRWLVCQAIERDRVKVQRLADEVRDMQEQQGRAIALFVADAKALIALEPRAGHHTSDVRELFATCVGKNYGCCTDSRPWMLWVYRLVDIEDGRYPFFLCPRCGTLLESNGVYVESFTLSDFERLANVL